MEFKEYFSNLKELVEKSLEVELPFEDEDGKAFGYASGKSGEWIMSDRLNEAGKREITIPRSRMLELISEVERLSVNLTNARSLLRQSIHTVKD